VETRPAILLGTYAAQLRRTRAPWPSNYDAHTHIAAFLPSKEISRADLALVSQRLAAVRLIACAVIETQRKSAAAIHMPARAPQR
jgi:hypothetical protein